MVIDLPRILVVALLAFTFLYDLKHLLRLYACCMIFVMIEMCAN
jgi:hypothetical protein